MKGTNLGHLLRDYAKSKGVTVADLGRSTGLNERTVRSCFEGGGSTKKLTFDLIALKLGIKKITYTVD